MRWNTESQVGIIEELGNTEDTEIHLRRCTIRYALAEVFGIVRESSELVLDGLGQL